MKQHGKLTIVSAGDIISYEDSKFLDGGITCWEAKHLIGNAKDRGIKNLIKRKADTIALAIDHVTIQDKLN